MKLISKDLPRHGSSSLRDDDHRPSTAALKEMAREQSLVMQLRAVVLPAIQADDERGEVIAHMFETILDCSSKAMTALKLLLRVDHGGRRADDVEVVDDKMGVRKVFSDDGDGDCRVDYDDNAKPHRLRKRRRLADDCVTLETPVPHYDGHQWRKYIWPEVHQPLKTPKELLQMHLQAGAELQGNEDGAAARRRRRRHSSPDDSTMYSVVYYGQHICKPSDAADSASTGTHSSRTSGADGELAQSYVGSLSQLGNISVTCTSVVVDGHHRTAPSSSLESNSKLLDMAEEYLTSAEGNKNVMFDVAPAYAPPLDFDTAWDWESMDAHVGDYWHY